MKDGCDQQSKSQVFGNIIKRVKFWFDRLKRKKVVRNQSPDKSHNIMNEKHHYRYYKQ